MMLNNIGFSGIVILLLMVGFVWLVVRALWRVGSKK